MSDLRSRRAGGGSSRGAGSAPLTRAPPFRRWVAYQEVGFSGEQYVLEKGVYRNCYDWGAGNSTLASLQPILQVSAQRRVRGLQKSGAWILRCARRRGADEGPSAELVGAGPLEGAELIRICVLGELLLGSRILKPEELRLVAGALLKSPNFGPSLQVGEHSLHFVSKVRSCGSPCLSPLPSFQISPPLPDSLCLTPSPSFSLIYSRLYAQIQLFSGPDFLGDHISFEDDQTSLPASFQPQSCRVHGGR